MSAEQVATGWLNRSGQIMQGRDMKSDRRIWNHKYQTIEFSNEPSGIVQDFYAYAAIGRALDIATGNGRNAVFLAHQGFTVDAVDISEVGLKAGCRGHADVDPICADLDQFEITKGRYDLIINIKYLNRRLFPFIIDGLAPGGVIIFETFLLGTASTENAPESRDHLLRKNELLHAFLPLNILYYRERAVQSCHKGPAHLASLVAVNPQPSKGL